jgi:hypothetical protein
MGWSEGAALFGLGHWPTGNGRMTVSGLLRRIGRLLATFSPQECRNFLRHAGYIQTCSESALITDSAARTASNLRLQPHMTAQI